MIGSNIDLCKAEIKADNSYMVIKLCGGAEIYTDARAASRRRTHRLWRSKHMSPKRIPPVT
jgi:hypothetical protein